MMIIFILHSNCELTLNDIHTGFLGNYIVVSACAKFKFLIVLMFYGLTLDFEQINYNI